jgi:hypothetical protein
MAKLVVIFKCIGEERVYCDCCIMTVLQEFRISLRCSR